MRARLTADKEFKAGQGWGSTIMDAFEGRHKEVKFYKVFDREVAEHEEHYSIHSASDGEHILVQASRT